MGSRRQGRDDGGEDGAPPSSHRHRGGHRSHRGDDREMAEGRHRRHRSRRRTGQGDQDDDNDTVDMHQHRHHPRPHSRHRRRGEEGVREGDVVEDTNWEKATRSHRRARHSEDDVLESSHIPRHHWKRQSLTEEPGNLERGSRRHRGGGDAFCDEDSFSEDLNCPRGRKRHRVERCNDDEANASPTAESGHGIGSSNRLGENRAHGSLRVGPHVRPLETESAGWSTRRGRQRMPRFAYEVDQQKHFFGFLDRHDASGSRAAAAMEFTIGPDGLVQMPPPPTLVRRHNHRRNATDSNVEGSRRPRQQQQYRTSNPLPVQTRSQEKKVDEVEDDETSSVASHESLYNDPASAQRGILPDIVPPSNLYRVALYGVDLSLTAAHLRSMVTQLLGNGVKPWRVRRPAREMMCAVSSYNTALQQPSAPQLPRTVAPEHATPKLDATVSDARHRGLSSNGVLADVSEVSVEQATRAGDETTLGVLSSNSISGGDGILKDVEVEPEKVATSVLGSGHETGSGILPLVGEEEEGKGGSGVGDGALPDVSLLPHLPQIPAPAFYLPGLHDVNGPGGMVVLEFTEGQNAIRTMQLLNGAYMNGRRVAASL